jgi:UDP-N-acetylglucosamine acyltransferase
VAKIHPLALVSASAWLGNGVEIGPYCVVEHDAVLGDGCRLESYVVIKGGVTLAASNHVFEGTVIGGLPQHVCRPQRAGGVRIGGGNVIREFVTIHRALQEGQDTVLGDGNLLMVNAHVAHDCVLGNRIIVANNTMLAGHVTVGDQAYISGAVGAHQYCRIGRLSMVGGQAHLNRDVPPFVTVDGDTTRVVGLNVVGLRRSGFSNEQIDQLKAAYRVVYRSGLPWQQMLARLKAEFTEGPAAEFHSFLCCSKRGFTPERRSAPATLKLHDDDEQQFRALAG